MLFKKFLVEKIKMVFLLNIHIVQTEHHGVRNGKIMGVIPRECIFNNNNNNKKRHINK